MVKIAAVQMSMSQDMDVNYHKTLSYVAKAAEAGAQMVCFPEGHLTEYLPQYPGLDMSEYAVSINHRYVKGFCDACSKYNIIGSYSIIIAEDSAYYPVNMIVDENGKLLMITKKQHIVRMRHFYEKDYYTPGSEGFPVCKTSIGNIGSILCFDRHYPESFRTLALKGADFIIVPVANNKGEPAEVFEWEMRIPAYQNSLYTLMINRVGTEGNMDYCGNTVFCDPNGNTITCGDDREALLTADLDFAKAKEIRHTRQYMALRRPEVFELD